LKARAVAGNRSLGEAVAEEVQRILVERFGNDPDLATGLTQIRQRLEQEIASDPKQPNFKTGVGGFYDVDYVIAFCGLRAGVTPRGRNTFEQIEELAKCGAISAGDATALRTAATFLRTLDHAIRLATGRAHDALPERPHWAAIAEMLSRWLGQPVSAASLMDRLQEHQRMAREVYQKILR
jgi:glutamine synthetase adenylyltransferase